MTPDQETSSSSGLAPLISGIINDAQLLVRQQLTLFQSEVKHDLERAKEAAISLIGAMVVSLLALFFLGMMLAHLLHWAWPEHIALFGAFGIVGLVMALLGGGLAYWGISKFMSFNPLPEKTVEGLKENIQWKTKT